MSGVNFGKFQLSRAELYYCCLAKLDFLDKQICSVESGNLFNLNKLSIRVETTSPNPSNQDYRLAPIVALELIGRQRPVAQFCKKNFLHTAGTKLTLRKNKSFEFLDFFSNIAFTGNKTLLGSASFFSTEKLVNLNLEISGVNFFYMVCRGKPPHKLLKTCYLPFVSL